MEDNFSMTGGGGDGTINVMCLNHPETITPPSLYFSSNATADLTAGTGLQPGGRDPCWRVRAPLWAIRPVLGSGQVIHILLLPPPSLVLGLPCSSVPVHHQRLSY